MSWFKKPPRYTEISTPTARKVPEIPGGLWMRCDRCSEMFFKKEWEENLRICPNCGLYSIMGCRQRLRSLIDEGSFSEVDAEISSLDPLEFKGYPDSLTRSQKRTGEKEAVICGGASVAGVPVQIAVFDFHFMAGSMGSAVGEKVTRTFERALASKQPAVVVSAGGGGARMHEGMLSLMQMAKTSAAVAKLRDAGVPFISIITDPTMGGVAASFASLGDVIVSEPGARIGFAGRRVIEQTIGQKLPEDFQTAECLLDHGMIDMIVDREELTSTLGVLLKHFQN